ncbi:fungal-specific transcription factor domain-containing protein [Hypoxylon sp. FL1284]|nr:fungal-specific transcription factor domain-containing protein [Hypoxylon sp. FL1284]
MFTTFVGVPPSATGGTKEKITGGTLISLSSEPPETSVYTPPKPKRLQVTRACAWCRTHRVKCDNQIPCRNCHSRGWKCSNKGSDELQKLAEAYREIDRLKQQVNELDKQLKEERDVTNAERLRSMTPISSPSASTASEPASRKTWDGVHASAAYSGQKTYYGPSSLFYFIGRMSTYLTSVLQSLHLDEQMELNSVAKSFLTPNCNNPLEAQEPSSQEPSKSMSSGESLTPTQEEYFLNLFWQSYHSSLLVLDEQDFKEHYKSLWATPGKPRKPSALVDIVIAMSMQYGLASIPRTNSRVSSKVDADDPTIAGRWYYRRCQSLLSSELESPTISTLQCQVLIVIWLCCASFQNMAHCNLALAVRTAQMLGLHAEPPETMPLAEKEMRKRLYWSLYAVESKTCMKLGRPFSLDLSTTLCSLPSDDHTVSMLAGSSFAPLGENVTWLSYNLYNTKLILAARTVHTMLYDKYSDVYNGDKGSTIYDDLEALERYADFLAISVKALDVWVQTVPDALKTKRENDGVAFSTDLSPLIVERFAPLWLQRQRLLLELLYHNLTMNLYRPFVTFPSASSSSSPPPPPTPVTQSNADSAVSHGMAISHIMYQILSETDILHGWHEAFQWQWNAALTLAGYLFAYPSSSYTSTVRKAVDRTIEVFDIFGRSFAAGNSAAAVMRDLAAKVDFLASIAGNGPMHASDAVAAGPPILDESRNTILINEDNTATTNVPTMDMAFSVDWSESLGTHWADIGNMPDNWGQVLG